MNRFSLLAYFCIGIIFFYTFASRFGRRAFLSRVVSHTHIRVSPFLRLYVQREDFSGIPYFNQLKLPFDVATALRCLWCAGVGELNHRIKFMLKCII